MLGTKPANSHFSVRPPSNFFLIVCSSLTCKFILLSRYQFLLSSESQDLSVFKIGKPEVHAWDSTQCFKPEWAPNAGETIIANSLYLSCMYNRVYFRILLKRGQMYCGKFEGQVQATTLNIGKPIAKGVRQSRRGAKSINPVQYTCMHVCVSDDPLPITFSNTRRVGTRNR